MATPTSVLAGGHSTRAPDVQGSLLRLAMPQRHGSCPWVAEPGRSQDYWLLASMCEPAPATTQHHLMALSRARSRPCAAESIVVRLNSLRSRRSLAKRGGGDLFCDAPTIKVPDCAPVGASLGMRGGMGGEDATAGQGGLLTGAAAAIKCELMAWRRAALCLFAEGAKGCGPLRTAWASARPRAAAEGHARVTCPSP